MPVCHLHTEMSQLWTHRDMCLPSGKALGDSGMIKWICGALWPTTRPVTGGASAGPKEDEPTGATIWGTLPHAPSFCSGPRSRGATSLLPPLYLQASSHLSVRDSAPSPHVVTSGCMCQRIFITMCACIYIHAHAYLSMLRCV